MHEAYGGRTVMAMATFGAGCFWGVEAKFRQLPGVTATAVGFMGGDTRDVTYRQVCAGNTGHAEVVQVEYDPAEISYDALLDLFWKCHDPTEVNAQGPDVGTQYRSVIFFHSAEQEAAARAFKAALEASRRLRHPVATEIAAAGPFWRAEEYHQQYLEKRGLAACRLTPA
jgi:peptide-methionine (S)-S-oxide reductase